MSDDNNKPIDIDKPRYDQNTYMGRAKHFFITTNPLNLLATSTQLENARQIVEGYRKGERSATRLSENEIWRAKHLYDSAFHPEHGEKMFWMGRMSAQVPMNMTIAGCMLTFYKSTPQVVFWQWINQSFNAVVNYTNRSATAEVTNKQLLTSYAMATTGAVGTALGLNRISHKFPPLIGRFVPFAAVAAANCINIPFMRGQEIVKGITVFTEDGTEVGQSSKAAKIAIAQVVVSRILMATPVMLIPPIIMQRLERGEFLNKYKFMNAPVQVALVGMMLVFATPLCCALFPQRSSMAVSSLEEELQERMQSRDIITNTVFYNKGL